MTERKRAQKYQNRTAFTLGNDKHKEEVNSRAPLDRLCSRCMD